MTSLIVVCPMEIERRALGHIAGARVDVCGPGPTAFRHWAASIQPNVTVILAGVAGGLSAHAQLGEARCIEDVWIRGASIERTAFRLPGPAWRVAGSDHLVATSEAKRQLALESGATIVDMESHAFTIEATRRGWRHAIVRGVSDGHDDEIPAEVESLVDQRGRTRVFAATTLLLRRPALLGTLRELGRRTERAMASVGEIVRALAAAERSR